MALMKIFVCAVFITGIEFIDLAKIILYLAVINEFSMFDKQFFFFIKVSIVFKDQ